MLKVQPKKQDEFSGALLWTGEITGTRKYKLLSLFASLSVVTFTVFQGGGGRSNVVELFNVIISKEPHNINIFGKRNNFRRAPDCLFSSMAHPDCKILLRIHSKSFLESLNHAKLLMALQ